MSVEIDLRGRRALVTGGGQGVGATIAAMLASAGAAVVVNDVVDDRAASQAERIVRAGGRAEPLAFDVTDHGAVGEAIAASGPIDILVNNAGNAGTSGVDTDRFVDTTPPQWERYIDVNLYGVMHCVHAALPGMVDRGWGRIITIVSDAGRVGGARLAAYSAAKAGAAGFCRAIAREVARDGVTVNNVALGTMRTELTSALWDDPERADMQRAILSDYLIRRPGEPDDAAWMVAVLASDRSAWITGQTVPVNGGYSFTL